MSIYAWQLFPLSERQKQMYTDKAKELGITYSELLGLPEQNVHSEAESKLVTECCSNCSHFTDDADFGETNFCEVKGKSCKPSDCCEDFKPIC